MKKHFFIAATVAVCCTFSFTAEAGFPVGAGKWLLSPGYYYYSANGYWNINKAFTAYEAHGKFTSHYIGLYGIYGINRNWEFVFKAPFISQTYTDTNLVIQNASMGDITAGFSYYPEMKNSTTHFAITGSFIIPLYKNIVYSSSLTGVTVLNIGFQSAGGEINVSLAGSPDNFVKNCYYDMSVGIRQYFSTYGPMQFFFDGTFGLTFNRNWKVYGNVNTVNSQSNYRGNDPSDGINRDFSYFKITTGVGYSVSKTMQVFGNIFQDISGKNIGRGNGAALFAIIKF